MLTPPPDEEHRSRFGGHTQVRNVGQSVSRGLSLQMVGFVILGLRDRILDRCSTAARSERGPVDRQDAMQGLDDLLHQRDRPTDP